MLRSFFIALWLGLFSLPACTPQKTHTQSALTFTNPLLERGADPYSFFKDGYYYYTHTLGNRLDIWKTRSIADLRTAMHKTVWTPPAGTMYSKELWAPQIQFLRGKWYMYFAADDGNNKHHRIYVIENSNPDPMQGEWVFKGKVADSSDRWAIDADVFELDKQLYIIWSGWEGDVNGMQHLYIAKMSDPCTISGPRVKISSPQLSWERNGYIPGENPENVYVNEGPQFLRKKNKLFIVYSASGCWTDNYTLGMLTANAGADLLDAHNWKKSPQPVFKPLPQQEVYAAGHNSFFKSPDGRQDWILYHANDHAGEGCGIHRKPRAQQFRWRKDGTPDFGHPVSSKEKLAWPAQ